MSPEEIKKITDAAKVLMDAMSNTGDGMFSFHYDMFVETMNIQCTYNFMIEQFGSTDATIRAEHDEEHDQVRTSVDGTVFFALVGKND